MNKLYFFRKETGKGRGVLPDWIGEGGGNFARKQKETLVRQDKI